MQFVADSDDVFHIRRLPCVDVRMNVCERKGGDRFGGIGVARRGR